jgi:hypothetical protein
MPSLQKEDIWLTKFLAGDQIFVIGSQLATRNKIKNQALITMVAKYRYKLHNIQVELMLKSSGGIL